MGKGLKINFNILKNKLVNTFYEFIKKIVRLKIKSSDIFSNFLKVIINYLTIIDNKIINTRNVYT